MLNVFQKGFLKEVSIVTDKYIPFTLSFGDKNLFLPPLYWRGGDFKQSLIEIGFAEKTGILQTLTLTSINPKNISETSEKLTSGNDESLGILVCDATLWDKSSDKFENRFIDEAIDFKVKIGQDHLSLVFESSNKVDQYIINQSVRFGVCKNNNLVSINLLELKSDQLFLLKTFMN